MSLSDVYVSKLTIIGSDSGLSPGRHHAIIWPNAGLLLIGPLGTNFNEIIKEIHIFSFKTIHLKVSSGKWQPFCLSLSMLISPSKIFLPTGNLTTEFMLPKHMLPYPDVNPPKIMKREEIFKLLYSQLWLEVLLHSCKFLVSLVNHAYGVIKASMIFFIENTIFSFNLKNHPCVKVLKVIVAHVLPKQLSVSLLTLQKWCSRTCHPVEDHNVTSFRLFCMKYCYTLWNLMSYFEVERYVKSSTCSRIIFWKQSFEMYFLQRNVSYYD